MVDNVASMYFVDERLIFTERDNKMRIVQYYLSEDRAPGAGVFTVGISDEASGARGDQDPDSGAYVFMLYDASGYSVILKIVEISDTKACTDCINWCKSIARILDCPLVQEL